MLETIAKVSALRLKMDEQNALLEAEKAQKMEQLATIKALHEAEIKVIAATADALIQRYDSIIKRYCAHLERIYPHKDVAYIYNRPTKPIPWDTIPPQSLGNCMQPLEDLKRFVRDLSVIFQDFEAIVDKHTHFGTSAPL